MTDRLLKKLREDAIEFLYSGISAVNPRNLFKNKIFLENTVLNILDINGMSKLFKLDDYNKIIVIGAGKASATMAYEVERILGDRITQGLVVTTGNFQTELKNILTLEAGHPLPDINGIKGSEKIINICKNAGGHDLIINLISGGASSLLPLPFSDVSLTDKIRLTQSLLGSGATIREINIIRKHISSIKGGRLMEYVYPATIINLIISDVIGDDLETIGSGLTVPDSSTFKDCGEILSKYRLWNNIPESIKIHLQEGMNGRIAETPKPGNPIFEKVNSLIIGNNKIALSTIKSLAKEKNYFSTIVFGNLEGRTGEAAKIINNSFKSYESETSSDQCLIFGGETEVVLKGKGKGGRNQELCLYLAIELTDKENVVFLSAGTDGIDGPTEAAGAICDGRTINRAKKLGMNAEDFLDENDSYNFFKKLDDLIITGPTGTNVMDIQILLLSKIPPED